MAWVNKISAFGAGMMPSGAVVGDGYKIESDPDAEARFRVTYEVDGRSVSQTVDLGKRWRNKYGASPLDEIRGGL